MTDNGLAALATAIHVGRNHQHDPRADERPHAHLISEREQEEAAAILGPRGVFLPEGLPEIVENMEDAYHEALALRGATIATLRAALDGLVEAAERVLAYGRVRPFADAARDQLRAALTAAKETP